MKNKYFGVAVLLLVIIFTGCKIPSVAVREVEEKWPMTYNKSIDTTNTAALLNWRTYFKEVALNELIDTALQNNQELNIMLQEIAITQNEVLARKGEYLPFVNIQGGSGVDKVGRYTAQGANDEVSEIWPGRKTPAFVPDVVVAARASWEVGIWHKLRDAKDAAVKRFLATQEGRKFMITNLIAEIANSYYELQAYNSQLDIVNQTIAIQGDALRIIKIQKEAGRTNELAVQRFVAEVNHTKSLQFDIQQKIVEAENKINFLVGRYPKPFVKSATSFEDMMPSIVLTGVPAQLLENRPDVKQAELNLGASKLDVQVAKKNFYPSLNISAAIGLDAFNPRFYLKTPQSMLFSLVGDMVGPIINRNALKAAYFSANAQQLQAVYAYEQTVLKAFLEVANQQAKIDNLQKGYDFKKQQVDALVKSINISGDLFKSARADYMEILLTQRDARDAEFELVETKLQQMNAVVNIYKSLGGGWR